MYVPKLFARNGHNIIRQINEQLYNFTSNLIRATGGGPRDPILLVNVVVPVHKWPDEGGHAPRPCRIYTFRLECLVNLYEELN